MQATTVKEVLIATKWILERYKWNQHSNYITKDGRPHVAPYSIMICPDQLESCCLLGAYGLVDAESQIKSDTYQFIQMDLGQNISQWNDTNGRTKQQVLDLLDKLIAKA